MRKAKIFLCTFLLSITLSGFSVPAYADTYYSVKSGDSLWKISKAYGTTVEQIQRLNSLTLSMIHPGQKLLLAKDAMVKKPVEVSRETGREISRGTSRIETIIEYAISFTGTPYKYSGQSPGGFDCSGYIQYVFKNFGIELPRTASEQFYKGSRVNAADARPGDIVAFSSNKAITHTGLYLGGGKFISSTSSHGVETASINGPYWAEHFHGFSKIIP